MKRRALLGSLGVLSLGAGAAAVGLRWPAPASSRPGTGGPGRLVTLSPAITESVLALGARHQLVGVSDYCDLPADLDLPRLGSSLTPNYEGIARLEPSLILCEGSAGAKRAELCALSACEALPWLTLAEVLESTRRIGQLLGFEGAARALAQRLEARLSKRPADDAPRVLLLLSYEPTRPAELWFIRQNSLHGAALNAAGAKNAIERDVPGLPRLSVEELLRADPDRVLLLQPPGTTDARAAELVSAFGQLAPLRAVRGGRVACVRGSQSVGPSILQLVDALEAAL